MSVATIGFEVALRLPPEQALDRVTEALKVEGFGVLTRIDVRETLRQKLGVEFRPYFILGACNPALARRALERRADAGLLLPCNVTVEADDRGATVVRIGNPDAFMGLGDLGSDPEIRAVGREARTRLERVAAALSG
jgi:uncharacterized protein (DUF302 family)